MVLNNRIRLEKSAPGDASTCPLYNPTDRPERQKMPHREKIHKAFFAVSTAKGELLNSLIQDISWFKTEGNLQTGRLLDVFYNNAGADVTRLISNADFGLRNIPHCAFRTKKVCR